MTMQFKASVLQYCAAASAAETLPIIEELVAESAAQGASFVCLPECATFLSRDRQALFDQAEDETTSPSLDRLSLLAKTYQIFLSVGSLLMRDTGAHKCTNRGYLLNPLGKISARYNKIHMFDATVGDGRTYRESERFHPGQEPVLAQTTIGNIGLSICYDIRFPELYQRLSEAGAELLVIPSAFTVVTGAAHWHILQRARAIETGCFVLSAAQHGTHADGRQTYGHALIVAPWGEVLADAGSCEQGFVMADIDLAACNAAQRRHGTTQNRQKLNPVRLISEVSQ